MPTVPLPVSIVRGTGTPLAIQLATQVRELVGSGGLDAGVRLPSSRALAAELSVARTVVEQAFDQLLAEGWVTTRQGAGTYVADVGVVPVADRRAVRPPEHDRSPALVRLDTGTPWVDPRHAAGWRRAWRDVAVAPVPRGYPDASGAAELRLEIAKYVARTRGVVCEPDQVMVTSGTTHALGLVLSAMDPGGVAIEDPGYRAAVATVAQAGRRCHDVPVDDEGLRTDALEQLPDDVRAVYVTPAHQHPLGMTMSATRRIALLAEAKRRRALVVEDDYDSEFRYDVAPLPALAQLGREQVVYLGTASKMVHPGLRLGWMVGDRDLLSTIAEQRTARHDQPPWPVQRAFLSMLREGHVDKLVRSARRVYAERGGRVAEQLASFGEIRRPVAGMYLTLALPQTMASRVRADCRAAGFDVPALSDYSRTSSLSGLVVGFGGVTDDELSAALHALVSSLSRHA